MVLLEIEREVKGCADESAQDPCARRQRAGGSSDLAVRGDNASSLLRRIKELEREFGVAVGESSPDEASGLDDTSNLDDFLADVGVVKQFFEVARALIPPPPRRPVEWVDAPRVTHDDFPMPRLLRVRMDSPVEMIFLPGAGATVITLLAYLALAERAATSPSRVAKSIAENVRDTMRAEREALEEFRRTAEIASRLIPRNRIDRLEIREDLGDDGLAAFELTDEP